MLIPAILTILTSSQKASAENSAEISRDKEKPVMAATVSLSGTTLLIDLVQDDQIQVNYNGVNISVDHSVSGNLFSTTASNVTRIEVTNAVAGTNEQVGFENSNQTLTLADGLSIDGIERVKFGVASFGTISATGTGAISVNAPESIDVKLALQTVDGDISLHGLAGQSGFGVKVSSQVQITGSGNLVIEGIAQSGHGVQFTTAVSTNTGNITINGTSGTTSTSYNGVNSNLGITSTSGNISITGISRGTASSSCTGIYFGGNYNQVTTTGSITLYGQGSTSATGNENYGMNFNAHTIQGTGANLVSLTGIGGGTTGAGYYNIGVNLGGNVVVSSTGSGKVEVIGTGGTGGTWQFGVRLNGNAIIKSNDGDVEVSGTGGTSTTSNQATGVSLELTSMITSTGTGNVLVTGVGGTSLNGNDRGIYLSGYTSSYPSIRSSGGNITIHGTAGNGPNSPGFAMWNAELLPGSGGAVSITGIGSANTGSYGVSMSYNSKITTNGGDLTMTGSVPNSTGARSVYLDGANTLVTATGSDNINITGTSGGSGDHYAVFLTNKITSVEGDITISGTNNTGNTSTTQSNAPVIINAYYSGRIESTGTGSVQITGTTNTTSERTHGIMIIGANAIKTNSGNIVLDGTGVGNGYEKYHAGVYFAQGQVVSTAGSVSIIDHNTGTLPENTGYYTPVIHVLGPLSFQSPSKVIMEPFNSGDKLKVQGTVNLQNASLGLIAYTGITLSAGTYVIVDNDGSDPIVGTFTGLAEGATVSSNLHGTGYTASISYVGGDGNDVAITLTAPCITINSVTPYDATCPGINDGYMYINATCATCTSREYSLDDFNIISTSSALFNLASGTYTLKVRDSGNHACLGIKENVVVGAGVDNTNPVINCQPFTLTLDNTGNGTLTSSDIVASSSDNCGIASFELSKSVFTTADIGTSTVTVTAIDYSGNQSSCNAIVTIEEGCDIAITSATPTDETCPGANNGEISVIATCTTCTSIEYSIDDFATAANTIGTFSGLPDGTYTVKGRDSSHANCNATQSNVTVAAGVDNTPPSFTDPSSLLRYTNNFETPNEVLGPLACNSPISQKTVNQLYDTPGFVFSQFATVETTEIGPGGYTDGLGIGGSHSIAMLENAPSNDDKLSLTFDRQGKDFLNVKMDIAALGLNQCVTTNPTTPTFTLRVYDNPDGIINLANITEPLLSTVTVTGVAPDPANPKFNLQWAEVVAGLDVSAATTNTISLVWDLTAGVYATFDNLEITAANTNIASNLPEDISIQCLDNLPTPPAVIAFDDCDPNVSVSMVQNPVSPTGNDQVITRTWTATDASSNSVSATQTITVDDVTPPTITAPADVTLVANNGTCDGVDSPTLGSATTSDNCSTNVTVTNDAPATFALGTTKIYWTADDGNGNIKVDSQLVIVVKPEINILGNSVSIVDGDVTPSNTDDTDFGGTDTATPVEKTFTIQNIGTSTLTLAATNQVTLTGDAEFTVLTQPTSSAIASGGSDLTFVIKYTPTTAGTHTASVSIDSDDCDEGSYTFTITGSAVLACDIAITSATPTDETCPGANNGEISVIATCTTCTSIEYSIDDFATAANTTGTFGGLPDGIYTVKVRDSGNANCNATQSNVIVAAGVDNTPPVLVGCPATASFTLDLCNEKTINADSLGITATDNCGTPTITLSQYSFTTAGTYSVTVTATDDASLTSTCVVSVTIEDNPDFFTISLTDDNIDACVDGSFTFTAASLLANDNTSNSSTLEVQEVTLTNPSDGTLSHDGNGNYTFTPANGVTGNVALTYLAKVAGEDLYFEPNGHYYEYLPASSITWEEARDSAETRTLYGQKGYLATITSSEENDFVSSKLLGKGWIGGLEVGGVGTGNWRWVTGPEALEDSGNGLKFWDGAIGGNAIPGVYSNWYPGEPNNSNNIEAYLHMFIGGQWNDMPTAGYNTTFGTIEGFVVEYGGLSCTPNFTATANITINVQLKPSIADIATQVNTCPSNVFDLGTLTITDDNSVPGTVTTFHGQKPTSATNLTNQLASSEISTDQKVYVMVANATTGCYDVDSFMVDITLCVPEMDVFGNSVEIVNGDTTPDTADDTDFGTHDVSAVDVVKTFTIENNGTADLTLSGNPIVTLTGSADFSVSAQPTAASISPAGSLTFEITFNPTSAGTATATVSIASDDADENPYTFDVSGTVTCDLAITSVTPADVNCPGAEDGTITVLATCTTCTSIEYSIDDFATSNTTGIFTDLPDGTYTVKVRDSGDAGCTASQTDVIVAPGVDNTAPVLSCPASKEIALNFCGETVLTAEMLDVTATDNCIANPTFSLSQTNFSGVGTSTVTVFATDGTNQSSCDIEVSFIEQTVSLTNNGPVCEGDSITFTATPIGENLGYAFFKQQKGGSGPTTTNSVSFYNSSNTYKTADIADGDVWLALISDGSGCTVYDTNLVSVNPLPTVFLTLDPVQVSLYDGVQTGLGGGSPAAGGATMDNINIDNVTLADGGIASGYVRFSSFVSGQTSPDFSVSVSGGNTADFPPLTYNQSNSTATISGGPNIVSIVNTTSKRRLYIQFSQNIQPGVTVTRNLQGNSKEDHNGALPSRAASGSVSTAPYTQNNGIYSGTGVTDQGGTFDFDPAMAGEGVHVISYTYTNASGCDATATANLEVIIPPCGLAIDFLNPTAESCTGENDGTITVMASCSTCSGGTEDLRYSLDSTDFSNTTGIFAGLAPGTYSVYVHDVNYVQCTASQKDILVEAANDAIAPVLDCPVSAEVELDICDNIVLTAELLNVTATDNCNANPVLSLSQSNFNGTGTHNITVFATDGVNQSQCAVEVTLVTNEAKLFLQAFDNPLGTYPFNTSVIISSAELLANDILINGINMEITGMVVDNPAHGTIINNNNGTYTFTPNSTYSGPVSLTYAVSSDACTPAISATAAATFDILPAPSNVEILDGLDNNGNGIIDEGLDCDPTLVAHWTFEPGNELKDLTGNFPDLTLLGATVSNGKLDVGVNQYATTSNFAGPDLTNKTLVAWVSLDQLSNSTFGGSALTIDKVNIDKFDGIVFSETQLNRWNPGSDWYRRTQSMSPGFTETATNQMVRMVITYQAGINNQAFVSVYRDNQLIGQYIKGLMETFSTGSNTEIFFGLRHRFPGGRLPGKPWMDGKIEEARIYDGCMTFAEIQTLAPVISGANLTITASDSLVCPGESVTLTVSGCTTGTATWNDGNSTNSGPSLTVVPSVTTTYQVSCSSGGSAQKTISVVENVVAVSGNIDSGTETVKAVQTITSDKKIGNAGVTPKPNVSFRAGNAITLEPGFETESSAVFKAEIKTCTE